LALDGAPPIGAPPVRSAPPPPPVDKPRPIAAKAPPPVETPASRPADVVLLTRVKRADMTPLPMPAPPPPDFEPSYIGDGTPDQPILLTQPLREDEPERPRKATLPGFPVFAPDPPLLQLRSAATRDEIAREVLDYVGQLTARVILFVVRKALLVGHDARGVDVGTVRRVSVHVDAPSLFRDVVASRLPYRGPLPETPANRAFAHAIGGVQSEVLLMPIAIRDRIVAVLYADGAAQPLPDAALHATTREAGLAYERLILEGKSR
jgi:hypothetical protein